MQRIFRHKWSLASAVLTVLNCWSICTTRIIYDLPVTGFTSILFFRVSIPLSIFALVTAIWGMIEEEPATYAGVVLVFALILGPWALWA